MLLILITLLVISYLAVSSLFFIYRDPHNVVNISLSAASILVALWLASVAGLYTPLGTHIIYGRTVFLLGMCSVYGLFLFVTSYVRGLKGVHISHRYLRAIAVGTLLALCLTVTPAILAGVEPVPDALPTPISGKLFPLYVIWMFILAGFITAYLLRALRYSSGRQKAQVATVTASIVLFVVVAFSTNLILPKLFNNVQIGNLTPLSAIILASGLSYAVVKHKLLNIRLLVARTVSYFLTWSSLSALYFLFAGSVVRAVLGAQTISFTRQAIYLLFMMVVALSYSRVKRQFDRLSNRLFYRDAYNPQDLIADLNTVMVSSVRLEPLLKQSAKVFAKYLKTGFTVFFIDHAGTTPNRLSGDKVIDLRDEEYVTLSRAAERYAKRVLIVDRLEHTDPLKHLLARHDVDVLVGLGTAGKGGHAMGCLMMGPRKSGGVYSQQDISIIHIVAYELAVAVESALRYEAIASFNETLQTEVEHATGRLRHANRRLKELDQLKDDFISMASHQFRTPAGSIRQALQMLNSNSTDMSATERKEILRLAEADSEELVTLVGTMLNISRLQAGRFVIEKAATDLVELLGRVVDTTNVLAERKGNKLTIETPEPHILAMVDSPKIKEAMTNYIENAIKYSPSKSTIKVSLKTEGATVRFEVLDQGMGVPEDERKNLFGRFYRARNARKERPDGNGIGLYVVKSIIEGHGGEVYYQPQELGSTFGFVIPTANKKQAS